MVRRLFKNVLPGEEGGTGAPPLSLEQLQQVRRLAFEKARELNMPEVQARLLADSLVGNLAVGA